jgi:hypothetical protein
VVIPSRKIVVIKAFSEVHDTFTLNMAASVLAKKLGKTYNIQRGISLKAEVMRRTSAVK